MPIATPEVYADMLDRAKAGSFAYHCKIHGESMSGTIVVKPRAK